MFSPGKVYYGHNTDIYVIDSTLVPKYTWNKCEISTLYSWNRFNVNRTYKWDRYNLDTTYVWNEYELACDWYTDSAVEYDRHSDSFGGRIWGTIGTSYTLYANREGAMSYVIDGQYDIYSTAWEDTVSQIRNPSYCSNCDRGGLDESAQLLIWQFRLIGWRHGFLNVAFGLRLVPCLFRGVRVAVASDKRND